MINHLPKEDKDKDSPGNLICCWLIVLHGAAAGTGLTPPTYLSMADLLCCEKQKRMPTILNSSSFDFYSKIPKSCGSGSAAACAASGNPSWGARTWSWMNDIWPTMFEVSFCQFPQIPPLFIRGNINSPTLAWGMETRVCLTSCNFIRDCLAFLLFLCFPASHSLGTKKGSSQTIFLFAVVWPLCELR